MVYACTSGISWRVIAVAILVTSTVMGSATITPPMRRDRRNEFVDQHQ